MCSTIWLSTHQYVGKNDVSSSAEQLRNIVAKLGVFYFSPSVSDVALNANAELMSK